MDVPLDQPLTCCDQADEAAWSVDGEVTQGKQRIDPRDKGARDRPQPSCRNEHPVRIMVPHFLPVMRRFLLRWLSDHVLVQKNKPFRRFMTNGFSFGQ
jgi:hypothetical protein